MKKISPLHDRVIVQPDLAPDTTEGGLLLTEENREQPLKGKILACGPGHANSPMALKEGDQVLYSKNTGTEVHVEGEKYMMMRERDVYAVLD